MSGPFMPKPNKFNLFLFAFLIAIGCAIDATAQNHNEWISSEVSRNLPGQEDVSGKTYFSNQFGMKEGTFKASYRSIFDKRNKVSGKFIVAKFRYIYDDPIGEKGSSIDPLHNESISTVMLDCSNNFVATLKSVYLLNGKTVSENIIPDEDIEMKQINMLNTTVGDLCAYAKKQGAW
ncbi:MAG: hypothetical protein HPY65_15595 [Syntrophaceae bacterium]|nr:hypothetical protein [Syntrophaceae bacterium]